MLKFICSCAGVAVFVGFIMLVGSPHYIETIIALCLGVGVGFGLYLKFRAKK